MRKKRPSIPNKMPIRCSLERPILPNVGLARQERGAQHSLRVTAEELHVGLCRVRSGGRRAGSGFERRARLGDGGREGNEETLILGAEAEVMERSLWQAGVAFGFVAPFGDAAGAEAESGVIVLATLTLGLMMPLGFGSRVLELLVALLGLM